MNNNTILAIYCF